MHEVERHVWDGDVFFYNDTATTEIYTLSLHDALPISRRGPARGARARLPVARGRGALRLQGPHPHHRPRSEEHTSELQSRQYLVCRLLLEKKQNSSLRSSSVYSATLPIPHPISTFSSL